MLVRQLGKYEIISKIGQGGMGEVFMAHDPILRRHVAIKTISSAFSADEERRKRFYREAQSAGSLSHPNIITIYDFGEEQGGLYMTMELLEGHDLNELIRHQIPLTLGTKLGLMEQICDGLAFAHAQGVVHRDLKPANIHVQPNGRIKILDFGLARPSVANMSLSDRNVTVAGMVLGTPRYMSPEQVWGEATDARSDVFSLGSLFYELLAYRHPFTGATLDVLLSQVVASEPEPLRQVVPEAPPLLEDVLTRAMAKRPANRFQDAGEMREALRSVRSSLAPGQADVRVPAVSMSTTLVGSFDWKARLDLMSREVLPRRRPSCAAPSDVAPAATPIQPDAVTRAKPNLDDTDPSLRLVEPTWIAPPVANVAPAPLPRRPRRLGGRPRTVAAGSAAALIATLVVGSLTRAGTAPASQSPAGSRTVRERAALVVPATHAGRDEAVAAPSPALSRHDELVDEIGRQMLARAQARARETDGLVAAVQSALDQGSVKAASRGIDRLLAIQPDHAAVPLFILHLQMLMGDRAKQAKKETPTTHPRPRPRMAHARPAGLGR